MSRGPYGRYKVTGTRQYRGHPPGTIFEARHDAALARGMRRGNITLLELITPAVPPGYRLPDDWPPPAADTPATTRRRKAPLL